MSFTSTSIGLISAASFLVLASPNLCAKQLPNNLDPVKYCNILEEAGHAAQYVVETGSCVGDEKVVGAEIGTSGFKNKLAFFTRFGHAYKRKQIWLSLQVFNPAEHTSAHAELNRVAQALSRALTGESSALLKELILGARSGSYSTRNWNVETAVEPYASGEGYAMRIYFLPARP